MKLRSLILAIALAATLLLSGCRSRYASLSRNFNNIEAVRLPRMVFLATGLPISSMDVVSCQGMKGRPEVMRAVDKAVAKANSELLLEVIDHGEEVRIYGNADLKKNKVKNLIIVSATESSLDFVTLSGTIPLSDLSKQGLDLPSLRHLK